MANSWKNKLLMKIAIAVFVKTPTLSPIKTRLRSDFGGKKRISKTIWTSISYSQNTTCEQMISKLKGLGEIMIGEENFDIDSYQDLILLAQIAGQDYLAEQINLINWVQNKIKLELE